VKTSRVVAALVVVSAAAFGGQRGPLPGPATNAYRRGDRERDDLACRACHVAVAREHDRSLHAAAFSDPSFQRGYAIEPAAFCRSCHAPESVPDSEPDAFAQARGVTCVTCHRPISDGPILSGPGRASSCASSHAPHAITRVDDFGSRACTACHEFAFPGASELGAAGLMQKTVSEHAASPERGQSCAACHMPAGDHRVAVSREPDVLRSALRVEASRSSASRIVLTLEPLYVGHAMPTGDLFRRLLVRVKTGRGLVERSLGRSFRARRADDGQVIRFESRDERLVSGEVRSFELEVGPDVAWEVVYQRVLGISQVPPFTTKVDDELVLASGQL